MDFRTDRVKHATLGVVESCRVRVEEKGVVDESQGCFVVPTVEIFDGFRTYLMDCRFSGIGLRVIGGGRGLGEGTRGRVGSLMFHCLGGNWKRVMDLNFELRRLVWCGSEEVLD